MLCFNPSTIFHLYIALSLGQPILIYETVYSSIGQEFFNFFDHQNHWLHLRDSDLVVVGWSEENLYY